MQVTRPEGPRRPGVRLHPNAGAALGFEADFATDKHLRPKYQDHVAGMPSEWDMPESAVSPWISAQRRARAQARGQTPRA